MAWTPFAEAHVQVVGLEHKKFFERIVLFNFAISCVLCFSFLEDPSILRVFLPIQS